MHELNSSEDRVTNISTKAEAMIEAGHYESEKIKQREEEIKQMWVELKEVTHARQEVCMYCKTLEASQVTLFQRNRGLIPPLLQDP